jgi:transcriptional regulator with XRE-family HTH domain
MSKEDKKKKDERKINLIHKIAGKNIREIREKAGLSMVDVAEKLNVTPQYIWSIENGRRRIYLDLLEKLARLFGVTVADFLKEEGNFNESLMKDKQINDLLKEWENNKGDMIVLLREFRNLSPAQLNSVIHTVKTFTSPKKPKDGDGHTDDYI